jgi:hypothetical protein
VTELCPLSITAQLQLCGCLCRRQPNNLNQQLPPKAMLCMLRQEYVVAESRMTQQIKSHLASVRMFRLNQQLNQARPDQ